MVAAHKGTGDVGPMFRQAKQVIGRVRSMIISDGAANFAEAHRDKYAPRNFLLKDSVHESHVWMDGYTDNSQMESLNSDTVRLRKKVVCWFKRKDPAAPAGLHVCHSRVRPHSGGRTAVLRARRQARMSRAPASRR
ncbi:MAG: hypothetical protein IS632_08550 [Thaumarchaeota archaeon]|nr:hypothetical protein [Nitrososphaerota archaeon]